MLPDALQRRIARGPLIADGAWGTELQKRGLAAGDCPDLWNLQHPELVGDIARSYREAGSEVVLTNTFRANRIALAGYGAAVLARDINLAGVEISRRCAPGALVFASVGPSGMLAAAGDVDESELFEAFAEQTGAQAEAGADAIVIETMSDLGEAATALRAARATALPVVVSFTFDSGRNHDRTMTGATPEQCAAVALEGGAFAVGANCGADLDSTARVCCRLRQASGLPVWAKPNAGLPAISDGVITYLMSADSFAARVPDFLEAGAKFIGGCCGTNPEFIRAAARIALR
jgi:5-methyltetrahydrofolate--homocysteine methyltransferase